MVETKIGAWRSHMALKVLCGAVLVAAVLSACGDEDSGEAPPASAQGQTIARVNGQEITEHELEAELERLGPVDPEERSALAREVLRRMVQRLVLAQRAEEENLHRTPDVMMDLRRKRAETLAKAYIENGLARQLPISKYDVEDFIDQHPHYFNDRKHYVFDQILIDNALITDGILDRIEDLTTLGEVEAGLKEMDVEFSRRLNANLSSQFPREAVVKIDALEPGEIFLTKTKDHAVISKLVGSRLQPVSGEEARNLARHLLTRDRDAVATRRMIDSLLAEAKIEFLGRFEDTRIFSGGGLPEADPEEGGDEQESAARKAGNDEEQDATDETAQ